MSNNETRDKNKATLVELFENFGPGRERWFAAYRKAFAPDGTWWMQGWPLVMGVEELEYQTMMLEAALGADSNPILEWRNIEFGENDNTIIYERRGSFADKSGNTITDWDIMGIIKFNDDNKIISIRDYFDNTGPYEQMKAIMSDEQVKALHDMGRATHPLKEGGTAPDPHFYKKMYEQMTQAEAS